MKNASSSGIYRPSESVMLSELGGGSKTLSKRMQEAGDMRNKSMTKSSTLPKLNDSQTVYSMYQSRQLTYDQVRTSISRLSGLPETVNTSALFVEKAAQPSRPVALCVRCSCDRPALCMICAEQDSQNALTFYRKTRAAGAATLFSKAFVEAGYSKLIKFVVFRLIKNSTDARKRTHLKTKSIVEKLFGANIVYLPFSAWKRFTKENILYRKNKTISDLSERLKVLETQMHKLTADVNERGNQVCAFILEEYVISLPALWFCRLIFSRTKWPNETRLYQIFVWQTNICAQM